jgi:DinB superfamily
MSLSSMEWTALLMTRELDGFATELSLCPDEATVWATLPGVANSIGTLTLHVCGNLQYYVGAVLGGTPYVRDRAREFAARGVPRAELLVEIARARDAVRTVLPTLAEADLATPYADVLGGTRPLTGLFLMHLTAHLSFHFGQAGYLRRALTGDGRVSGAISIQSIDVRTA